MARIIKKLTSAQVANAKPKNKLYRLYDGDGLCLKVTKAGAKVWEYRHKNPETQKDDTYIIGDYPFISLSQAREIHTEKRMIVFNGISPKSTASDHSFKAVYELWFEKWQHEVTERYAKQQNGLVQKHCMKHLAKLQVCDIDSSHIYKALQEIEKTGSLSQIRRAKNALSAVFKFAAQLNLCRFDPTSLITANAFKKHIEKPHRSLPLNEIYKLHELFQDDSIDLTTRNAIQMTVRSMLRLQEVTMMRWSYINEKEKIIVIPKSVMKTKKAAHVVPITSEIQMILDEQSNDSKFVFPRNSQESIPKYRLTRTFNELGIDTTTHGLRHLASTILNEFRDDDGITRLIDSDLVEKSLAHAGKDKIRNVYNLADYIEPRRAMLVKWSDFIDKCDTKENNERALKEAGISLI